jgi:hypothetical protein
LPLLPPLLLSWATFAFAFCLQPRSTRAGAASRAICPAAAAQCCCCCWCLCTCRLQHSKQQAAGSQAARQLGRDIYSPPSTQQPAASSSSSSSHKQRLQRKSAPLLPLRCLLPLRLLPLRCLLPLRLLPSAAAVLIALAAGCSHKQRCEVKSKGKVTSKGAK